MAYRSVTGTLRATNSNASHHAGGTDSTTQTGDVYLAWDQTKITKLSDLKSVLRTMLLTIEGGML